MKKFVSTMNKGFHMTFANGLTVSVQWGAGNYCDNHFPANADFSFSKPAESDTAEVAVWDKDEKWIDPQSFVNYEIGGDGMVVGWLTADQVVEWMHNVALWDGSLPLRYADDLFAED